MEKEIKEMPTYQAEMDIPEHFFREIDIQFLIHEMKDPIAVVETGIRTLLDRQDKFGPLSTSQERTLKRSLRNVVKAREMLNGLLEVGRSEAGVCISVEFDPAPAILKIILDALETRLEFDSDDPKRFDNPAALQLQLEKEDIFLTFAPRIRQIHMCQDETRFHQILGNLLKNALYHRQKRIEISVDIVENFLVVAVTDDGPGIDPEYHQAVFKRYVQVSDAGVKLPRKGHGLGLAGALIMAKSLGGTILLDSAKGQGATFSLRLPITYGAKTAEYGR